MALLRRKPEDPIAALERELSDLTSRRNVLDRRLATAASDLAQAFDQRRQALLDSDLSDEAASARRDAACHAAQDRHNSTVDALGLINGKISDVQTQLIAARDHAERSESASAIRAASTHVTDARDEASASLRHALDAAKALASTMPVNPDLVPQLNALAETFLAAVAGLVDSARSFAAQTESGHAPMHRPSPPAPETIPLPPIERQRVFTLNAIRWAENGQVRTCGKYNWIDLPKDRVAGAIERGFVDLADAERTRRMIETFGALYSAPPHPSDCIDIDHVEPPLSEQTLSQGFIETVGVPRIGTIGVG